MAGPQCTASNLNYYESLLSLGKKVASGGKASTVVAQRIAGAAAYREYDFLRNLPGKNVAGNFRGMVVNKNARVIYQYVGTAGKRLGHAAAFLAVGEELVRGYGNTTQILDSSDDDMVKASKISFEVSAVGLRTLGKIGTGFLSAGSLVLRGADYLTPGFVQEHVGSIGGLANELDAFTAHANTAINTVYTGENIYTLVTQTVQAR